MISIYLGPVPKSNRPDFHVHWDNRLGLIAYVGEPNSRNSAITRNIADVITVAAKRGGIYAR